MLHPLSQHSKNFTDEWKKESSNRTRTSGLNKAYKELHDVTYHKNGILIVTTMNVSNLTHLLFVMDKNSFREVEINF